MKKIIALFFAILLCLTFTSCDDTSNNRIDYNGVRSNNKTEQTKEKIKYMTVSFETNGGSYVKDVTGLTLYSAPETSKNGFLFQGWYLDQQLTTAAVFPLDIKTNMILYAKWLKTYDTITCVDTEIKMWEDSSPSTYYYITPNGFDLETLANLGYQMTITVSYDIRYERDYKFIGDIGYAGAPKYDVSITNDSDIGQYQNNLSTTTSNVTKTISYRHDVIDIKTEKIKLKFSTENIQNTIFISNIKVTYECTTNSVG